MRDGAGGRRSPGIVQCRDGRPALPIVRAGAPGPASAEPRRSADAAGPGWAGGSVAAGRTAGRRRVAARPGTVCDLPARTPAADAVVPPTARKRWLTPFCGEL